MVDWPRRSRHLGRGWQDRSVGAVVLAGLAMVGLVSPAGRRAGRRRGLLDRRWGGVSSSTCIGQRAPERLPGARRDPWRRMDHGGPPARSATADGAHGCARVGVCQRRLPRSGERRHGRTRSSMSTLRWRGCANMSRSTAEIPISLPSPVARPADTSPPSRLSAPDDVDYQPPSGKAAASGRACRSTAPYDFGNSLGRHPLWRRASSSASWSRFPSLRTRRGTNARRPLARVHAGAPPFLLVQGTSDNLVSPDESRAFVDKLRTNSSAVVAYAEVPRGQHAFDVVAVR